MPESAVDRLIREERERSKLYRDVLGGGVVGEALRQVNDRQKLLRGLDFDKPYRGILDTLERDRTEREAFKGQTSTAWALSVTETARSIASRNTDLVEQQRRLSSTVLETMRVFDVNRTTIGTALAAARGGDAYLAGLPRAVLSRDAIFRRKPERAGEVVLKASEGEVVAIAKTQGRWRLVVFRDPLSNQLAQAWVYQTALTPLAQPLPQASE